MKMISTKNTKTHEGKELILINFGSHGKLEWRKFVN